MRREQTSSFAHHRPSLGHADASNEPALVGRWVWLHRNQLSHRGRRRRRRLHRNSLFNFYPIDPIKPSRVPPTALRINVGMKSNPYSSCSEPCRTIERNLKARHSINVSRYSPSSQQRLGEWIGHELMTSRPPDPIVRSVCVRVS